ncbi:hypothetical protein [Kitasatospora sp. NPDC047058]|uniref:hypothetical protein n=1 Tax=Kitasatospora sp. NPDC047058 TaxID=3155620 RepID=UPI00340404F5
MTRPSTRRSDTGTGTRLKRLLAVALMVATLGACMSNPGTGKYDPLPVKSQQETLDWARQLIAHLVQTVGIEINSEPEEAGFHPCIGRNGESAPDGRYTLLYFVHSDVPGARHNDVVRSARDLLTKEGLKVTVYREATDTKPSVALWTRHPESNYTVRVDSTSDKRMALSVTTPCLMPPSASPAPTQ